MRLTRYQISMKFDFDKFRIFLFSLARITILFYFHFYFYLSSLDEKNDKTNGTSSQRIFGINERVRWISHVNVVAGINCYLKNKYTASKTWNRYREPTPIIDLASKSCTEHVTCIDNKTEFRKSAQLYWFRPARDIGRRYSEYVLCSHPLPPQLEEIIPAIGRRRMAISFMYPEPYPAQSKSIRTNRYYSFSHLSLSLPLSRFVRFPSILICDCVPSAPLSMEIKM